MYGSAITVGGWVPEGSGGFTPLEAGSKTTVTWTFAAGAVVLLHAASPALARTSTQARAALDDDRVLRIHFVICCIKVFPRSTPKVLADDSVCLIDKDGKCTRTSTNDMCYNLRMASVPTHVAATHVGAASGLRRWVLLGIPVLVIDILLGQFVASVVRRLLPPLADVRPIWQTLLEIAYWGLVAGGAAGLVTASVTAWLFRRELPLQRTSWYLANVVGACLGFALLWGTFFYPEPFTMFIYVCPAQNGAGSLPFSVSWLVAAFLGGGGLGFAQWRVLRQTVRMPGRWIPTVAFTWAAVLAGALLCNWLLTYIRHCFG